jgi:hypothetical protein
MNWAVHVVHIGGRPRRRLMYNIKMPYRNRMGWYGRINLALDRYQCWAFLNTVMNLRVLQNVGTFLSR